MNAHDLYLEACRRGLRWEPAGEKLAVWPKGHCPPDFAAISRENKNELLNWLARTPCPGYQAVPPPDIPLNPARPRPDPADARHVMDYIVRQMGETPCALCEWCLRRELAYGEAFHWPDQLCAYAAARDAACWQLGEAEADIFEILETFGTLSAMATESHSNL